MTLFKKYRQKETKPPPNGFLDLVRTFAYAILIAVGIRSLAFEPFNIPSASMLPTLLEGDFIFVSKMTYGYSRYSFPFGVVPLPGERVFASQPKRGDVAVFKLPRDPSIDYVKRIIGLPGDHIQMTNGLLSINGQQIKRQRISDFVYTDKFGQKQSLPQVRETLPDGRSYLTLDIQAQGPLDSTQVFVVPANHYFVMGDNRDNSVDSRVAFQRGGVGFVPIENLVGRADVIWYSTQSNASFLQFWDVLWQTRLQRLFQGIE